MLDAVSALEQGEQACRMRYNSLRELHMKSHAMQEEAAVLEAARGGMAARRVSAGRAAPAPAVVPPCAAAAAAGVSFPILLQAWRFVSSLLPRPSIVL